MKIIEERIDSFDIKVSLEKRVVELATMNESLNQ